MNSITELYDMPFIMKMIIDGKYSITSVNINIDAIVYNLIKIVGCDKAREIYNRDHNLMEIPKMTQSGVDALYNDNLKIYSSKPRRAPFDDEVSRTAALLNGLKDPNKYLINKKC